MFFVLLEYFFDLKVVVILILIFIYWLGTYKQNLHLKLCRKGPRPLPFLGNMFSMVRHGVHEFDLDCRRRFGKIYPMYFGRIPLTMVSDEELLKQIFIKEFKCFTDRLDIGFKSKTTEKMITMLEGKDWERVRNLITPTFTSGKLKKMSPLLEDCVDVLIKCLHESAAGAYIDTKGLFGSLTMDVIARTMFGMDIDSQKNPNNAFIVNAKKILNISLSNPFTLLIIVFPSIGKLIRVFYPDWEILGKGPMSFFKENIHSLINERRISKEVHNDFLALMLSSENELKDQSAPDVKYLTSQEIAAQSLIFLIAGYETTANTLMYISYFLAKNPDIQEELHDELMSTMGTNNEISYEMLMRMPLLDGAISESLRLCPPVLRTNRVCNQDVDLVTSNQSVISAKKGDIFAVPIYSIHMDPEIWPDPNTFDIHRYDSEKKKNRSPYAFMPFGLGPRNCVGMRFALLEIKWALARVLKEFEIHCCDQTPKKIRFKNLGLSQPAEPIIVQMKARK